MGKADRPRRLTRAEKIEASRIAAREAKKTAYKEANAASNSNEIVTEETQQEKVA